MVCRISSAAASQHSAHVTCCCLHLLGRLACGETMRTLGLCRVALDCSHVCNPLSMLMLWVCLTLLRPVHILWHDSSNMALRFFDWFNYLIRLMKKGAPVVGLGLESAGKVVEQRTPRSGHCPAQSQPPPGLCFVCFIYSLMTTWGGSLWWTMVKLKIH